MQQAKYPPHAEDLEKLAEFFDQVDTTELEGLEEMGEAPERDLGALPDQHHQRPLHAHFR